MRRAVLLLLTGCGRLAFDDLPGPVDAAPDGGALACGASGGHDEDGDGLPDDCDPCPTRPGSAADTDGDGVGDACDPLPSPTERFTVFDPFTGMGPSWQSFGTGTFAPVLGTDELILPGLGNSSTAYQIDPPARETIEVMGRITAVAAGPHALSIKVSEAARVQRYHCELRSSGNTLTFGLLYTLDGTTFMSVNDIQATGVLLGQDVFLRMQRDLPDVTCTVVVGGQIYSTGGPLPVTISEDEVWVAAVDLDAALTSITRVATP